MIAAYVLGRHPHLPRSKLRWLPAGALALNSNDFAQDYSSMQLKSAVRGVIDVPTTNSFNIKLLGAGLIALFSWEELGARPHRATGATFDGSEDCEGGRKPEIDSTEKRYSSPLAVSRNLL